MNVQYLRYITYIVGQSSPGESVPDRRPAGWTRSNIAISSGVVRSETVNNGPRTGPPAHDTHFGRGGLMASPLNDV